MTVKEDLDKRVIPKHECVDALYSCLYGPILLCPILRE
jgi:hypothetical protein